MRHAHLNARDYVGAGLLGEELERNHARLELSGQLTGRRGAGDPRYDRGGLSVDVMSLRTHAVDYGPHAVAASLLALPWILHPGSPRK